MSNGMRVISFLIASIVDSAGAALERSPMAGVEIWEGRTSRPVRDGHKYSIELEISWDVITG